MKKTIQNILCVIVLVIFVFGAIQIWSVTTVHSRYEIVTGNGYTKYVGPSVRIDIAKLIRNFYKRKFMADEDFRKDVLKNDATFNRAFNNDIDIIWFNPFGIGEPIIGYSSNSRDDFWFSPSGFGIEHLQ